MLPPPLEPHADCQICPRLVAFRGQTRRRQPSWFNSPVPSFAPRTDAQSAPLLIVGLAPGLKGANRTGRPFTGDFAGDLLYATLIEFGFARGTYRAQPDDGLELTGCIITNTVRCVPPQNKPTPAEINACQPFLAARFSAMPLLRAVLALGRIAHDSVVQTMGARKSHHPFGHAARHELPRHGLPSLMLFDSYHCSRYNTNTRVLTPDMFRSVFADVRRYIDTGA